MMLKTVACGISGGVDSAVSAFLLRKLGYRVYGVFMKNWDEQGEYCTIDADISDAKYTCNLLGIPFVEANFVKEYWNDVFSELIKEYQNGFTPNPDILCNKKVKFNIFHDFCKHKLNADLIATGHYARVSENLGNGVKLLKATDQKKDQTFFLSQIPQEALQNTIFPLSNMIKCEVKELAYEIGLGKIAKKKESTGICFIGKRDFQSFINDYIEPKPGHFIDIETREVLGTHNGIHCWTLGQRCHIGGKSVAYFVAKKNVETQDILVAPRTDHPCLFHNSMEVEHPHFIHSVPNALKGDEGVLEVDFRFQHTILLSKCSLVKTTNKWTVQLQNYTRALTPGQYAVFYLGNECLGSSRIIKIGPSLEEVHFDKSRAAN